MNTDVKKVERFTTQCLAGLRRAEALRPQIITREPRTVAEALVRYNELLTASEPIDPTTNRSFWTAHGSC